MGILVFDFMKVRVVCKRLLFTVLHPSFIVFGLLNSEPLQFCRDLVNIDFFESAPE